MLLCHNQKQKERGFLARDNPNDLTFHTCDSSKEPIVAMLMRRIPSLQKFRKLKVLSIRRQLGEGKYDLDRRLEAAMDRVIKELRE
jgi:hypothetical protein